MLIKFCETLFNINNKSCIVMVVLRLTVGFLELPDKYYEEIGREELITEVWRPPPMN